MPMKIVLICAAFWLATALVLVNSAFAFVQPERWLAAKWTFTRGFDRRRCKSQAELSGVFVFAVILLAIGLLLLYASIMCTVKACAVNSRTIP